MDKEKDIEEMAGIITNSAFNDMSDSRSRHKYGVSGFYAEALIKAGYGNVAQAVKEFAEELKVKLNKQREFYLREHEWDSASTMLECAEWIDNLIKERIPDDTL